MKGLLILIAFVIIAVVVSRLTRKEKDPNDFIDICRPCLEERFDNMWLGKRTHRGECQVCHNIRVVDHRPIDQLHKRGES